MKNWTSHHVRLFALVLIGAALAAGCKRKDRLTSNDFDFSITPPAAAVVKGQPVTLTANTGGSADIQPTWEVTPTTAGTFSPAIGRQVTFTPTLLGDATVLATYDGVQARSQLAVVTYLPVDSSPNRFDVYTDGFFTFEPALTGPGFLVFVGPDTTAGVERDEITEENSGYTPQGLKYFRLTARNSIGNNFAFWGVSMSGTKNLSSFSFGSLKLALRTNPQIGAIINTRVEINDGVITRGVNLDSTYGFSRLSTDWQEISIPISDFTNQGINLSNIQNPFAIALQSIPSATTLVVDVDAVRWEK